MSDADSDKRPLFDRLVSGQPLVQFLLLGALIFAVELLISGREDDPRRIVIDDAKYAEIAGIFRDNQGREPSAEEMADLTVKWAQNELLYREARLMGLDNGDEMIRERLILKLRNVVFNQVERPKVSDEELRKWFESERASYDKPARYDLEQVPLENVAANGRAQAEEIARGLSQQSAVYDVLKQQARSYQGRPFSNFVVIFGEADAAGLLAADPDQWRAVSSTAGWHAARITAQLPGEKAVFADLRSRLREDYKTQHVDRELVVAMQRIAERYDISMQLSESPPGWEQEQLVMDVSK